VHRREEERAKTLLQSALRTHCKDAFLELIQRAVFPALESLCAYAFHECLYVCCDML
jgi:hypothetical protein